MSSFVILFILFVFAIEYSEVEYINTPEAIFMIYALGFCLEKVAAMQEHGIQGRFVFLAQSIVLKHFWEQYTLKALGFVIYSLYNFVLTAK